MVPHLIIIILAFVGFLIAFYLNHAKKGNEPLVCPLNFDCSEVIKSSYSTFCGISVEVLGMIYYATAFLIYAAFLAIPVLATPTLESIALVITGLSFLFSLYLAAVQVFVLRELCSWCLFSTLLCFVIFFFAVLG